jgi:hypothetical protein
MHATPVRSLLLSIALATVLAVGAGFAWMVAESWVVSVANQLFSPREPNEQLVFTEDGQPLVQNSTYFPNNTTVYRTLDGEDVKNLDQYELQNGNGWLPGPDMPEYRRLDWRSRIIGFNEPSGMPYYWYLIADGEARGQGYFRGYDAKTKHPVGYLGLAGFRTDPPPVAEQFEIDRRSYGYWSSFAGQSGIQGQEPNSYWRGEPPAIFLDSGESLFRVDLRHRSVASVPLDGKVVSVGNIGQPVRVPEEPRAIQKTRIGIRQADRVVLLDDSGTTLRSIPIPPDARARLLDVCLTTGPESIVVAIQDIHHDLTEIYWLAPGGEVMRHEQLRLRGGFYFGGEQPAWQTALGFPSPLLCAISFAVTRPQQSVAAGRFADFPAALAASLAESWPAFLAVLGLSAVLAGASYRRHFRFGQRGALAWAIFVLLGGPAGMIGYLLHRHWPAIERCQQCGATVPRDRDGCRICSAEFPAPAPRGIEIFA